MNMLLFEYRNAEKQFFDTHKFQDLNITFFSKNLCELTELTKEEFEETEIISISISSHITKEIIAKFKNLRIISTRSDGYNHIDLKACAERHIAVINVDSYDNSTVAQFTIGSIINLIRNVEIAYNDLKLDKNNFDKYTGYDLKELSAGIIGTGAIGTQVCKMLSSFGCHIFAFDYKKNKDLQDVVDYVSLEDLLKHSNIISLHIPLTKDNYHFISTKEINIMSNEVYIINTSRGELIDNIALYQGIKNKKIAGCALDVLECENITFYPDNLPKHIKYVDENCLRIALINKKLMLKPNVIITPHIAYNTYKSTNIILEKTFKNIKQFIEGKCDNRIV